MSKARLPMGIQVKKTKLASSQGADAMEFSSFSAFKENFFPESVGPVAGGSKVGVPSSMFESLKAKSELMRAMHTPE